METNKENLQLITIDENPNNNNYFTLTNNQNISFEIGTNNITCSSGNNEPSILPTYRFDERCQKYTSLFGVDEFSIIKNENGVIHMAMIDTVYKGESFPRNKYGGSYYYPTIQHVRECFPIQKLFDLMRTHIPLGK
jgi:hypothetical protein